MISINSPRPYFILYRQQTLKARGNSGLHCQLTVFAGEKPAGVACKLQPLLLPMSMPFPLSPTAKVKALRPTIVHREKERGGSEGARELNVDKMTHSDKRLQKNKQSCIVTGSVTGLNQARIVQICTIARLQQNTTADTLLFVIVPSFWLY